MKKAGFRSKRSQQRGRGGSQSGPPRQFPDSYFGTDEQGRSYLQPDFVSKRNVDPLAERLGRDANPKLTTGQMRRFFNHCREIERRLKVEGESWEQVSARFESLSYHAQNAKSAGKIPQGFQDFIDRQTGAAARRGLRSNERVAGGAEFKMQIVLQVFDLDSQFSYTDHNDNLHRGDEALQAVVADGLKLVQRTGLGGGTSRGSGAVSFHDFTMDGQPWTLWSA